MKQIKNRKFRKLSVSDLQLLMNMNIKYPEMNICEENARQFLLNPMNWIFACIQDDQIIAHLRGYELNVLSNKGNAFYIFAFGVDREYHRQGIGTNLFTALKETCKSLNMYKIYLNTEKSNIAACGLYEKSGGKFDTYFKDENDCGRLYVFDLLN